MDHHICFLLQLKKEAYNDAHYLPILGRGLDLQETLRIEQK